MRNTSLLRRFGAILYDTLLVAAILFLVTIPFIAMRRGAAVEPSDFLYQLSLLVVTYTFFVGFWTAKGRTLGMQSWGLQLESGERHGVTLGQATIRFFAALLSWAPLALGFLWQLWDKDGLTWHDRLSGTRLVHYPKTE